MGLHFHDHSARYYKEQGKEEQTNAQAQVNAFDKLNTELELHILSDADRPKATDAQRKVSHFATKLKEAVFELRHPLAVKPEIVESQPVAKPKP